MTEYAIRFRNMYAKEAENFRNLMVHHVDLSDDNDVRETTDCIQYYALKEYNVSISVYTIKLYNLYFLILRENNSFESVYIRL